MAPCDKLKASDFEQSLITSQNLFFNCPASSCFKNSLALCMALTSTISKWSLISFSMGRARVLDKKARSVLLSNKAFWKALLKFEETDGFFPVCIQSTSCLISLKNRVWAASHLLNSSESFAIKNASSSWVKSVLIFTGAENCLKMDGRVFSGMLLKIYVSLSFLSSINFLSSGAKLSPFAPMIPNLTGIWKGFLISWFLSGGVFCSKVISSCPSLWSKDRVILTLGVPDCEYHNLNCSRSRPEASCITKTKSSIVTAMPSNFWK